MAQSVLGPDWLGEEMRSVIRDPFALPINLGPQVMPTPSHHDMLAMRMRWGQFSRTEPGSFNPIPFDDVHVHATAKEALVFVVVKGEPVVIRDGIDLFPSDTLVTQLRLLEQNK